MNLTSQLKKRRAAKPLSIVRNASSSAGAMGPRRPHERLLSRRSDFDFASKEGMEGFLPSITSPADAGICTRLFYSSKIIFTSAAAIALSALLASCCANRIEDRQIVQAGWFDSFAAGDFKGFLPLDDVAEGADAGLGTFEGVDGELIILDGKSYRVASDGKVELVAGSTKTPFAMGAKVKPDATVIIQAGMTPAELAAAIDKAADAPDKFIAVKAKVRFASVKLRSPPKAVEPYPTLAAVIAKQHVFELKDVEGTLVGFRSPTAYKGLNVPGCHFHFLSGDMKSGGHILDFKAASGTLDLQRCDSVKLLLPDTAKTAKTSGSDFIPGESAGH